MIYHYENEFYTICGTFDTMLRSIYSVTGIYFPRMKNHPNHKNHINQSSDNGLSLRISFCQATGSGIALANVPLSAIFLRCFRASTELGIFFWGESISGRIRQCSRFAMSKIISASSGFWISILMVCILSPRISNRQDLILFVKLIFSKIEAVGVAAHSRASHRFRSPSAEL